MAGTCVLAAAEASHDFKSKIGKIGLTGVASATGHSELSALIARGLHKGTDLRKNCQEAIPGIDLVGVKTDEDMMKKIFQIQDGRVKQRLVDDDIPVRGNGWRSTELYVSTPDLRTPRTRLAKHMFVPRYLTTALACPTTETERDYAQLNNPEYLNLFKIFSHTFKIDDEAAVEGSVYDGGGLSEQNNQVFVFFDQAQQVLSSSKKKAKSVINRERVVDKQQLYINIVFAASSFSDPGPIALPNAATWVESNQATVKAYPMTTWTYTDEVDPDKIINANPIIARTTVPAGDSLSLSLYEIKTDIVINNDGKHISNQVWTDPASGVPINYPNSAETSTIKSIADRFKNIAGDDDKKSRELQTKRVGDYFQVRDTKNLPDNAIKANDRFLPGNKTGFTFPEPPPPRTIKSIFDMAVNLILGRAADYQRREWYRKRTFFFTGDWMAFLCAAHNEVNCVYVNSNPGGVGANSEYDSLPVQGLVCLYFE
jgi:hypothetical protein